VCDGNETHSQNVRHSRNREGEKKKNRKTKTQSSTPHFRVSFLRSFSAQKKRWEGGGGGKTTKKGAIKRRGEGVGSDARVSVQRTPSLLNCASGVLSFRVRVCFCVCVCACVHGSVGNNDAHSFFFLLFLLICCLLLLPQKSAVAEAMATTEVSETVRVLRSTPTDETTLFVVVVSCLFFFSLASFFSFHSSVFLLSSLQQRCRRVLC
jgi:hypothetical protein